MHDQREQIAKRKILVTGTAGFIGSNLAEQLLKLNQKVVGLDNFATGHKYNLEHIKNSVSQQQWDNFAFTEGDITNYDTCVAITKNIDIVLHQAALGSVPRSIDNPVNPNAFAKAYNTAAGGRETLNNLFSAIKNELEAKIPNLKIKNAIYRDFRAGDIRHSNANIASAKELLGYEPTHILELGLKESIEWYINDIKGKK